LSVLFGKDHHSNCIFLNYLYRKHNREIAEDFRVWAKLINQKINNIFPSDECSFSQRQDAIFEKIDHHNSETL
jgi:hypothetical protein